MKKNLILFLSALFVFSKLILAFSQIKPQIKTIQTAHFFSSAFAQKDSDLKLKVMFPSGKRLVPTYVAGVPLGKERPLMEPIITAKLVKK